MDRVAKWWTKAWPVLVGGALLLIACTGPSATGPSPQSLEETTFAPELGIDLTQMTRLNSGMYILDLHVGDGPEVMKGDSLLVHYSGWLVDGRLFDSSEDRGPEAIHIGVDEHIQGWEEGIPGIREGGKRRLVIPYSLAYNDIALGIIPPYANLIYDVEVIEIIEPNPGEPEENGES